jgi:hypothetical protein
MWRTAIGVSLGLALATAGCAADRGSSTASGTPTASASSPGAPRPSASLPDTDGPSVAPIEPPYTAATLRLVVVEAVDGEDMVTFMFTGRPKCTVTRLHDLPAGQTPVTGTAFLQVTCAPARGPGALPSGESSQILEGERAAVAGRASNPGTVNVTEAVQTSDGSDVLVWTIGLRHSAPWGVGAIGDGPIVGVQQ